MADAPPVPAPPVFQPPVVRDDEISISQVAAIARDLATNMNSLEVVLRTHGVSRAMYDILCEKPFFKKALENGALEWHKLKTIQQRLALQSLVALENAMPSVAGKMKDPNEDLDDVTKAANLLAQIGGLIGKDAQFSKEAEKVVLNLNFGDKTLHYETKNDTPPALEVVKHDREPTT
jgi:hypothetical protein